jgi:uroporphyrinogen decarboxylase-like protein
MIGREKIEAALAPQGTPEIPAVICYEGITIRDCWEQLTRHPWWFQHAPDLERQMIWRREVIASLNQDWMMLPTCLPSAERDRLTIEENANGVYRVDRSTGQSQRLERASVGGWSEQYARPDGHPDVFPQTADEVNQMIPLPAHFDASSFRQEGRDALARELLSEFGDRLFPIAHVSTPLWRTYELWGFEGMMVTVARRPDLIERACERLLAGCLNTVRRAAALGAAGIWIEDCMTDMIRPEAFESLHAPTLRRLVDAIHALKMKSIHYFCGNPAGKWDLLLSSGTDALALEEGKKGFEIDIDDVVDRVQGRCAVLGNLDAIGVLEQASDEELQAEVARQIAAGRRNGSRFIMSVGSPVTPATPVERVRLYCNLVREAGTSH